jgi:creatinine amidohydrolase
MKFVDYTYEELARLAPHVAAVFIPLGCTEQQGPHLAVDFDSFMIESFCEAISGQIEREDSLSTLVMPTLPFGPTPEHTGFGQGYVNLRQSTHEAIVQDILESLAQQSYTRLLIWRGCGQHRLDTVVRNFNTDHSPAVAYQPVIDYGRISLEAFGEAVPGGHADSFATSICQFLDHSRIRENRIVTPALEPFEWSTSMDFAAISNTGVIGDPGRASPEAGARIWQMCIDAGANIVRDILNGRDVPQAWHFLPEARNA